MTPRVTAAIALRIIALVIMIWALSDSTQLILMLPRHHLTAHSSNPTIAPSFDRSPIASATPLFLWFAFLLVMRFIGGLLLLFVSKPLGKLLARGLES